MTAIEILFWSAFILVFFTYIGYAIIMWFLAKLFPTKRINATIELPEVTVVVCAYNEATYIQQKAQNTLDLIYPEGKKKIVFVTDGSDDGTPELLTNFAGIDVMHQEKRAGKIAAMNRAMTTIKTPFVVFTDANTHLNAEALLEMMPHFQHKEVGCVAGEKNILVTTADGTAGVGEGMYWKYESFMKKNDSQFNSAMGAAGELFAIRTELYKPVESDTLLDDFMIAMRMVEAGYKIVYEPKAVASERPSANIGEELKRKIRIAAGGLQSIGRLKSLLNPFKNGFASFQFIGHRVLRWTITPIAFLALIPLNFALLQSGYIYQAALAFQVLFYAAALLGSNEKLSNKFSLVKIPYYFFIMNYAVFMGFKRHVKGSQSVLWERVARSV